MAPKFGTSGLRGLVTDLTDPLCAGYTRAFLEDAMADGTVLIGRDLRASSERIGRAVAAGAASLGFRPIDVGVVPTPALAMAAARRGTVAVMVTGSHIPDDRNGLKFYTAKGEITKDDERRIAQGYAPLDTAPVEPVAEDGVLDAFMARYADFFAGDALAGLRIGVYEHASAAREMLAPLLERLGAETVPLARADRFVPVDTEAVDPATRERLRGWAEDNRLDAVVSTDGDGDRPMVTDADGRMIPGDRLGPLAAQYLGADVIVTPVSSNGLVDRMNGFDVRRTRIGSPYVIEGMEHAMGARVVGYEANGGFLLGFTAEREDRNLAPLMTRDSVLPIVAPLAAARAAGQTLADLNASLPPVFTAADRLQEVPTETSARLIGALDDGAFRTDVLGEVADVDRTDGYRATLADGRVAHLRPSGNAPEFRVYTEAGSEEDAEALLSEVLGRVRDALHRIG